MFHSSLSPGKISLKSKIKVIFGEERKDSVGFFHHILCYLGSVSCPWLKGGSSSRSVLGWNTWSLWRILGCFAASLYMKNSGELPACSTRLFPPAREFGGAWSLHWCVKPTSWCCLSLEPELGSTNQALYLEFEFVFWPVVDVWNCKRICLSTCHKFCSTDTGLMASHWTYTAMLVPKAVRYLNLFYFLHVNLDVCSSVCLLNMNLLLD